jgi:hypothetical protein
MSSPCRSIIVHVVVPLEKPRRPSDSSRLYRQRSPVAISITIANRPSAWVEPHQVSSEPRYRHRISARSGGVIALTISWASSLTLREAPDNSAAVTVPDGGMACSRLRSSIGACANKKWLAPHRRAEILTMMPFPNLPVDTIFAY